MRIFAKSIILRALGALLVVGLSFFGSLLVLDYWDRSQSPERARDALRAEHARLLKDALERYRAARGTYPLFPDNPVLDLKPYLVDGGYIKSIPQDPLWPDKPYRYTTAGHNGERYGLLFHVEGGKGPTCRTGVKPDPQWWTPQPECPF
jgi:hypothetical protein